MRASHPIPRTSLALALALAMAPTPVTALARDSIDVSTDTLATPHARPASRFYVGGSLGLGLNGRQLQVSVQPLVGYKLTPKTSIGTRFGYEYVRDSRRTPAYTWSSYGGGLFGRHRFHPRAYAHTEFEMAHVGSGDGRAWVPFLWIGGGSSTPLAPRTSLVVEVLVDVLRDARAPSHRTREPRVSVGVVVGF